MNAFEQHCTEESLELYAMGKLEETSVEFLEQHLLICESCCSWAAETENFVVSMRTAAAELRAKKKNVFEGVVNCVATFFAMPSPAWAAAATGLVLGVSISTTYFRKGNQSLSPSAVSLSAIRGSSASAPANRPLNATLDTRGLKYSNKVRVEAINPEGRVMETSEVIISGHQTAFPLGALPAGDYFVRIYASGSQESIREYSLQLK